MHTAEAPPTGTVAQAGAAPRAPADGRVPDRIRVLHLIESLGVGGAERRLINDLRWLDRTRYHHRVVYLTPADQLRPELEALGISVEWLGLRHLRQGPQALRRLVRLFRAWRPHLVHTQVFGADVYGRVAAALAAVPIVVSTVQTIPYDLALRHLYSTKRRMADGWTARRLAHRLIAVSDAVREGLIRHFRMNPGRIAVIPNGVDGSRFGPDPADRQRIRRELGLGPEEFIVLIVGRLIPEKRHELLLAALQPLAAHAPGVRLVIAGDGPLRHALERAVQSLGLQRCVTFLGTRSDAERLYHGADAFALPSVREGSPAALVEAMASELPVLASAIPQHGAIIDEGLTGRLIDSEAPGAWTRAFSALQRDPERGREMARRARLAAVSRFSAQAFAGQLQALYDELCADRKKKTCYNMPR